MKFKILNSSKLVEVPLAKYLIKWDKKVTRGGKKNFGKLQFNVKQLLRPYWEDHVVLEEMPVAAKTGEKGKSIDIVNLTEGIALEINGEQHNSLSWMHKDKECLRKQFSRDDYKLNWAELNNLRFIEIYEDDELNEELLKNLGIIP